MQAIGESMTFEEWWQHVESKNPDLKTSPQMEIRTSEFKRICQRAFDDGAQSTLEASNYAKVSHPLADILKMLKGFKLR